MSQVTTTQPTRRVQRETDALLGNNPTSTDEEEVDKSAKIPDSFYV
jgi:hypothetical protein